MQYDGGDLPVQHHYGSSAGGLGPAGLGGAPPGSMYDPRHQLSGSHHSPPYPGACAVGGSAAGGPMSATPYGGSGPGGYPGGSPIGMSSATGSNSTSSENQLKRDKDAVYG